MRTRNEIEKEMQEVITGSPDEKSQALLLTEIFLDIRDLLSKPN